MKHNVIQKELTFGGKIAFVNVPDDTLFNFRIYLNSGDQFAPTGKFEVSHILEHCLFEKNKNYENPLDFKIAIEKLGAAKNGFTSYLSNWYIINGVIEKYDKLLDILLKLVFEVELTEDIFNKQKEVVRNELTMNKNEHTRELSINLSKQIKTGLKTYEERLDLLDNVTFEDAKKYYEEFYVPANCTFVFSGNLEDKMDSITLLIEEYFKNKDKGTRKIIDFSMGKDYAGKVFFKELTEKTSFDFNLRFLIENEDIELKEQYVMFVNTFMSGQGSRIQNKAREQGLIYSLQSTGFIEKNYINIGFSENTVGDKVIPLIKLIIDEIKDVFAGNIEDKEIERALGYLYGNLQRRYVVGDSILSYYTEEIVYDDKWKDLPSYLKRVKEFTKNDIIEFGKKFDFSKWMFGILGNGAEAKSIEVKNFLNDYLKIGK